MVLKRYLTSLPSLLTLQVDAPDPEKAPIHIVGPTEIPRGGLASYSSDDTTTLQHIIQNGMTLVITLSVIVALFVLIWGGISWIMSQGDKNKVQAARNRIIYAIVGLVLIFLSFLIVMTIGNFFGVDALNTQHLPCSFVC